MNVNGQTVELVAVCSWELSVQQDIMKSTYVMVVVEDIAGKALVNERFAKNEHWHKN